MAEGRLRLYDSTRLDAAKKCMRYYYLRHEKHFRSEGTGAALVFGSSWGAALDVVWANTKDLYDAKENRQDVIDLAYNAFIGKWTAEGFKHPDEMTIDDIDNLGARTPTNALEMIGNYIKARENLFTDPSFELISIEEPFIVPLDPADHTLFYVGRMDKVFRYRKRVYGLDHKSTSLYRGTKGKYYLEGNWLDSWGMNDQVDGYSFAGHQKFGAEFGGVWIDGALIHKSEHNLFQLIPIDKQMPQLNSWLWETHAWIDEIEANESVMAERSQDQGEYFAAFKRNRKSCVDKYGKCPMYDVCRMIPDPSKLTAPPIGFVEEKWEPFKELHLERLGITEESVKS